jgi:hypothetical protein
MPRFHLLGNVIHGTLSKPLLQHAVSGRVDVKCGKCTYTCMRNVWF